MEKSTSWSRSQLIVIVCATMSTAPDRTSGIRSASEMALNWTLLGLPKIAFAIACTMSMSNPSIFPSRGLR